MSVWAEQKWSEPKTTQSFELERTTLTFRFKPQNTKSDGKKVTAKSMAQKQAIIEYLTNKVSATSQEIADLLDVGLSRAKNLLRELVAENIVVAEGADKNRTYRLKR
ncbi:MAG: hypothetical protein J6C62_05445 [Clostridia bacterium]|nr:hypothetical protein [Clostridia bacterium]MBO5067826.1 hypothetical protein [Clostridia bacterium]